MSEGISSINNMVGVEDCAPSELLESLQNEYVGLERVVPSNVTHYKTLLKKKQIVRENEQPLNILFSRCSSVFVVFDYQLFKLLTV